MAMPIDADRCRTHFLEALPRRGESRRNTHSDADFPNKPLREDKLIVFLAEAYHHDGKHVDVCCRPQSLFQSHFQSFNVSLAH